MSTPAVRQAVMAKIRSEAPTLELHDLSDFVSINDLPATLTGVTMLTQFIGGSEDMITIAGEGNQGWSERGSIALHYLIPTGFDFRPHTAAMETLRQALRGSRLQDIVLEAATPFTDQISNAVRIDGGWHGWVSFISYYRHDCG